MRPDRATRLEIGGFTQFQWSEGSEIGRFSVARSRLQFKGRVSGDLRFEIDLDAAELAGADAAARDALKDVILEGRTGPFRVRAGQFKKLFFMEEAVATRRLQILERGILSSWLRDLGYAGRDVGVEFGARWEGGRFAAGVTGQVWNGEGDDLGREVDGAADALVHVAIQRGETAGLEGALQWKETESLESGPSRRATAAMASGWIAWKNLRAEGEILDWRSDVSSDARFRDDRGWGARALLAWERDKDLLGRFGAGLGVRGEYLEPNRDVSRGRADATALWTPTATVFLDGQSRIRFGPRLTWYQDDTRSSTTEWLAEWQISY